MPVGTLKAKAGKQCHNLSHTYSIHKALSWRLFLTMMIRALSLAQDG